MSISLLIYFSITESFFCCCFVDTHKVIKEQERNFIDHNKNGFEFPCMRTVTATLNTFYINHLLVHLNNVYKFNYI